MHSKSPLGTSAVGVGQEVLILVVEEVVDVVHVGPQEHADKYRAGAVPHAAVALVGVTVAVAVPAVKARQKSTAELSAVGFPHGKRAR